MMQQMCEQMMKQMYAQTRVAHVLPNWPQKLSQNREQTTVEPKRATSILTPILPV